MKTEAWMEGWETGCKQGLEKGIWIGWIQTLEEFLDQPQCSRESLEARSLGELESLHLTLHAEYEVRFKRH